MLSVVTWVPPIQRSMPRISTRSASPRSTRSPLGDSHLFARLRLRLTPIGERVLRGEADRVEILGIDRWIGGTHVTTDSTWRWDAAALKLVR